MQYKCSIQERREVWEEEVRVAQVQELDPTYRSQKCADVRISVDLHG